jgi:hypothetical protein
LAQWRRRNWTHGQKTRRKWVRTLDKLRETHATELKQLERGQKTLTHFLVKPTSS